VVKEIEAPQPPRRGRKRKRKVEPNKITRPRSAYTFYMAERRPIVQKENPGMNFAEVSALIGKNWNDSKPDNRYPYEQKASVDRQRWTEEKARSAANISNANAPVTPKTESISVEEDESLPRKRGRPKRKRKKKIQRPPKKH